MKYLHRFRGPENEGIAGVMQASVSTDSIENTITELYTQGGVIIGIAMILLALAGVFAADGWYGRFTGLPGPSRV